MSDTENSHTGRRSFIKATGALGVGAGVALTSSTAATAATGSEVGPDSFDNALPAVILNPGGLAFWAYTFGGGDRGFQIAGPNPLPPLSGSRITFFDPGKSVDAGGFVNYFLTTRNDGGAAVVHNLEGGGLI